MAPNYTSGNQNFRYDHIETSEKRPDSKMEKTHDEDMNGLGTFRAAWIPLGLLYLGVVLGYIVFGEVPRDTRTQSWLLLDNFPFIIGISTLYVLFSMTWGPSYMRDRQPMQLKGLMLGYNAFQVALSAYMFYEVASAGWFNGYNYRCEPCDYSNSTSALRVARFQHIFFLSKIADFVDTVLFVLRKKFNQVTLLHVIHHSSMVVNMWHLAVYVPGGHITFMGLLNSLVHTIMYSYYLLSALGPKVRPFLWWKKYLTTLQLVQFVCIFIHTAQLLPFPCEGVSTGLVLWTLLYDMIFFVLFIDFYVKSYLKKKSKQDAAKSS